MKRTLSARKYRLLARIFRYLRRNDFDFLPPPLFFHCYFYFHPRFYSFIFVSPVSPWALDGEKLNRNDSRSAYRVMFIRYLEERTFFRSNSRRFVFLLFLSFLFRFFFFCRDARRLNALGPVGRNGKVSIPVCPGVGQAEGGARHSEVESS